MRILVPLDGSDYSEAAIPWARLLAEGLGGEVHLLRSHRSLENVHLAPQLPITVAEMVNERENPRKQVSDYLAQTAKKMGDIKVTTQCVEGRAALAILDAAPDFDLIVMASHGAGGISRWLLGGVTTKVVRASNTPVLVVSIREGREAPPAKLERIMVALDESERAEVALSKAAQLAKAFGSTLILYEGIVNVWKTAGPDEWAFERAQEYLTMKANELPDLATETKIYRSSVGPQIVENSEAVKADLIVMCSHGRGALSTWVLGSVTENVLQRAGCPVLVYYNRPGAS